MKIYTVHIKPGMDNARERPVFVKESFNFWAFVFSVFWALYQRLWVAAVLLVGFNGVMLFMLKHHVFSLAGMGVINIGFHILVGFLANDWLRARLTRRGYIMVDVAAGDNLLRAEQRYFERVLAAA